MPAGTAEARITGIESEGATVEVVDGTYDDAVAASAALAADDVLVVSDTSWDGYVDVPADVIDGYTTIFAEVDEQLDGDDDRPRRGADGSGCAHRRGRRALLGARRGGRGRAVVARRAGSSRPVRASPRSCPDRTTRSWPVSTAARSR